MSENQDQNGLEYGPLSKTQTQQEKEAWERRVEAEEKRRALWGPEIWKAAWEAERNGTYYIPLYPVVFSKTGLLSSPQGVQKAADLPTIPEVEGGTKATSWMQEEEPLEEAYKVRFCKIDRTQLQRIQQNFNGEWVIVWVRGEKRMGWIETPEKENSTDQLTTKRKGPFDHLFN